MNRPLLHNIQSLRGIAVIMVLALHIFATEKKYSPDQLLPDFLQLGAAGVDIFFVISGFIMTTVTRNMAPDFSSASQFLLLRITRIYPLYWVVSLSLLSIAQLFPGITTPLATDSLFVVKSLLLYPQEHLPLLMVGWTLVHEMYFYAVFTCLLLLPRHYLPLALGAWSIAVVFGYNQLHLSSAELQLVTHPMTLEFISGCALGLIAEQRRIGKPLWFLFGGLSVMLASWMHWQISEADPLPIGNARIAYFLPGSILITAGCIGYDQRAGRLSLLLEKIGNASYSIYLTHILFLSAFCKAWQFIPARQTLLDNAIFLPLSALLTLMAGMMFYTLLEKKLMRKMRKFIVGQ